ncbi:MAG TPA: DUF2336 domain-containing protein [Sphingomicrobium sp.]
MKSEQWPNAAPAADQAAPARAVRERLATVRADFFLDPAARLTEQERALMTAMLHCLVGDIADEIRAALPSGWAAANDESNADLIDALTAARLLDDPTLMLLLLRRADEERLANAAKARSGRSDARVLQGLVSHENGAVSAAAMALILARGRRRDRFGQCLLAFDDLPATTAAFLVHSAAAFIRGELAGAHGTMAADDKLAAASARLLASHDPSRAMDALAADLVRVLDEAVQLNDALILAGANEGEIAFVAHALARRSGLSAEIAFGELLSARPSQIMTLFRIAGLPRDVAAGLVASIGDLLGVTDAGEAMAIFDGITVDEANSVRAWLATEPAYRDAVELMETGDGQRSL